MCVKIVQLRRLSDGKFHKLAIQIQVYVWNGGGAGLHTKQRISNNSNVSITGVHDKKINCKTYFFGIYSPNETAKTSKIHTSCFGYFSFKVKTLFLSGMIQYLVPTKLLT